MPRARKPHRILPLFLLLLIGMAAALLLVWGHYRRFVATPIVGVRDGTRISVARGNGLPQVLRRLRAAGVQQGNDLEWQMLARQVGAAGRFQVGEYALRNGMTPGDLLRDIRDGKVVSYRFTLVDGWNIRDLRRALARAEPLKHTVDGLTDAQLMEAIGHAGQHPEGRFLPETYQYNIGDSDVVVLKQAYSTMQKALAAAWADRVSGLPLRNPDEALTLASIVEKETGVANERAKVAGVFVRRLEKGMRLETDPTVIYGMGERYRGDIHKADLQADTPYNTYLHAGLPPTPIAMPSLASLRAVSHPDASDALYFVAAGDGSGRSLYAATLEQHQANVRTYLERYRAAQAAGGKGSASEHKAPGPSATPAEPPTETPSQATPQPDSK